MTKHAEFDTPYKYHSDYYSINTGAHRKGGVELSTPTLTHHLGLWYAPSASAALRQRSVDRFGPHVDQLVWSIWASLKRRADLDSNLAFRIGGIDVVCLFGGAYYADPTGPKRSFEITTAPSHFALKDAIDSDNRILFMKAEWSGLSIVVRCEFHSEYFTITRFATVTRQGVLHESLSALPDALSLLPGLGEKSFDEDATAQCHQFLYHGFWEVLDRELFDGFDLRPQGSDASRIFADFRGLVVAGNDGALSSPLSIEPFSTGDDRGRPFAKDWPVTRLFPSIWPFLTVRNGLDLKRREFTASFMLDRRAVYITALGPQPPVDHGFRCAPLQYLLVARPTSDWQLGALVDRLHYMGAVRLAALMELGALRQAGANIRDMEREADAARRAIEVNDIQTALDHYKRAIDFIAHKKRNGKPLFWAGLQFRVERSRYYVHRFLEFASFLDMSPIQGFQKYDNFVRGRLGNIYDYINRLGQRQERAIASAANISQQISVRESSIIARTIEKLQTKAEIALLAVIVPHYLIEIVNEVNHRWKDNDRTILRWDVAMLAVGILFAGVSLATYLLEKIEERDFERLKQMARKYSVLGAVSAAIIVFTVRR